jgi:hypothetical protein
VLVGEARQCTLEGSETFGGALELSEGSSVGLGAEVILSFLLKFDLLGHLFILSRLGKFKIQPLKLIKKLLISLYLSSESLILVRLR